MVTSAKVTLPKANPNEEREHKVKNKKKNNKSIKRSKVVFHLILLQTLQKKN